MSGDGTDVVWVHMGAWALGRAPEVLKATLGSCVGIALLWPQRGVAALAHCLLPTAPAGAPRGGARYVDQALATLLHALAVPPARRSELQVHLGGGAQMLPHSAPGGRRPQVGRANIEAVHSSLAAAGLASHYADIGGHCARQIIVDCARREVRMLRVAGPVGLNP